MKVFLGGTVNGSKWREYVMPRFEIDYFDPVVADWNEEAYQRELYEREHCDYCLYVLTPKLTGYYSLAEVMDDSYKRPDRTIYCYLTEDEEAKFNRSQIRSMELLGKKIEDNGAIWLKSLDETIEFLNSSKNLQGTSGTSERIDDVFISYGRKHSKNFATKLHANLSQMGYSVWFDQNDIPLGVDFQEQINQGITKAHNFVFIISPHSVRSEYCLREIVLAVKLQKRIIPLFHVDPKEDMPKIHPTIEKLNWIYFQEDVNDFETSLKGLVTLIESHKDYVAKHTFFLNQALEWEKKNRPNALLLTGPRRRTAEAWLRLEFEQTQPPCIPPDISSEFICSSKEVANEKQTDVFFCYDGDEIEIPTKVFYSLMRKSFTAWTKAKNVKAGDIYENEAIAGIEKAANFIYIISKTTITSKSCLKELEYAYKLNKRILPFAIEEVDKEFLPEMIRSLYVLEYVDHTEAKYSEVFGKLLQVIEKEKDYFLTHREILVKAIRWEQRNRSTSLLLHGYDLETALEWLQLNADRREYAPLPLHSSFISESNISRPTVYITYNRTESTEFVGKLCNYLVEEGFDIWNQVTENSEDVENVKTNTQGIIKADAFIYVISSQIFTDTQCQNEYHIAKRYCKRVVPLFRMNPKTVAVDTFSVQEKSNFCYFQEGINNFDESFSKLIEKINKQIAEIKKHTSLLITAVDWEKTHRNESYLLNGTERRDALTWLSTTFQNENSACQVAEVQADFICESKKVANLGYTEMFFCYAREDENERNEIRKLLNLNGITSWVDTSDIKKGVRFGEAINTGIEQADNFLYLISPASVESKYCLMEIKHVVKFNKRIIPILLKDTDITSIPEEIRQIQFVDFTSVDFSDLNDSQKKHHFVHQFNNLLQIFDKEKEYHQQHKIILNKALKWDKQNRNPSVLVRGYFLESIETWYKTAVERKEQHPIPLVEEFILESKAKSAELIPDLFIAYHLEDVDFVTKLSDELDTHGKIVWNDHHHIPTSTVYHDEIKVGIESAYNFILVVTPNSLNNKDLKKEVDFAISQNKRMVLLIYKPVNQEELFPEICNIQQINFIADEKPFPTSYSELLRILDTDREYLQIHSKWQRRAKEWEESDKSNDRLLRGNDFHLAETWMAESIENRKTPGVTPLQKEFLEASNKAILAELRAKARMARFKKIMLILMVVLFFCSIVFAIYAVKQSIEAEKQRQLAVVQKDKADQARIEALAAKASAIKDRLKAIQSAKEATLARDSAIEARKLAIEQENLAKQNAELARHQKLKADSSAVVATNMQKIAETEKVAADTARTKAEKERIKAERLFLLSEARALAVKSLKILNDGDKETAKCLALHAYYMNKENNGPKQVQDIFIALNTCLEKENGKQEIKNVHKNGTYAIAYNQSKNLVASGANDRTIKIWEKTQKLPELPLLTIPLDAPVNNLFFSPDGKSLISATLSGKVQRWELNFGREITFAGTEISNKAKEPRAFSAFPINATDLLIAVTFENEIFVSKVVNGTSNDFDKISVSGMKTSCAYQRGNDIFVVAGGSEKKILQWQYNTDKKTFYPPKSYSFERKITALTVSSDGKRVAFGCSNGYIEIRESESMKTEYSFLGHNSNITELAFNQNNTQLASSCLDNSARLWLIDHDNDNEPIIFASNAWIWSLVYTNDNKLITVGENNKIEFWNTSTDLLAEELCTKVKKVLNAEQMKKYTTAPINYSKPNCVSFK